MAIAERWFLGGLSQTRATLGNRQVGMSLAALDILNAASCQGLSCSKPHD